MVQGMNYGPFTKGEIPSQNYQIQNKVIETTVEDYRDIFFDNVTLLMKVNKIPSYAELERNCYFGHGTLTKYNQGTRRITFENMVILANYFGKSLPWMLEKH